MKIKRCTSPDIRYVIFTIVLFLFAGVPFGKVRPIGKRILIRPITIRNITYSADGTVFAIPNFISAGSVALFWVSTRGEIAPLPSRFSEKNFTRSSGLFFLRKKNKTDENMAFISLPELLSGYSVDFTDTGKTLAIAGGSTVEIYDGNNSWKKTRTLTIGSSVTRAVFSPDGSKLGVISDGQLYIFSTQHYKIITTITPAKESRFSDISFSNDNTRFAVFEFRSVMFDFASRIRVYISTDGSHDHDLHYFNARPSSSPETYFPLVSFSPKDTALAVTIPTSFTGKILLVKTKDGTVIKEFKGFCHAFSPDGTLFIAQNTVFSTSDWSPLGSIPRSTVTCAFSPTDRSIITVTKETIKRFRVEE